MYSSCEEKLTLIRRRCKGEKWKLQRNKRTTLGNDREFTQGM